LLIDCEEDRTLRAVLFGMLRERDRNGKPRVTFLQEREERISDLFAHLRTADSEQPEMHQQEWNELKGLLREYSNEIAESGVSRPEMRRRVLALLDKYYESRWKGLPSIEHFELIGLLRMFASESIKDGYDKHNDMKAFMKEWDVHHRGIMVHVTPMAGWSLAREDVLGKPFG
jgi:hypothetical protein